MPLLFAGNRSMLAGPNATLECEEGFFFDQNGTGSCLFECNELSGSLHAPIFNTIAVVGIVASVLVVVLAFTTQRKL